MQTENNTARIHRSTLLTAIFIAIGSRSNTEIEMGYTFDSGFLAALKEFRDKIEAGAEVKLIKE